MEEESVLAFNVMERYSDCDALRPAWNVLLAEQSEGILHHDVTSSCDWTMALWRNFLQKKNQQVLVMGRGSEIAGILPLYRANKTVHAVRCRMISPLTELFSGRCGFLLREPRLEELEAMIEYLYNALSSWDVFVFTLVEGSPSQALWFELARRKKYPYEPISVQTSPYIVLEGTWQEYLAKLPKKFVSKTRKLEGRLRACGELRYREIRLQSDVEHFTQALLEIEEASWKATTGTALTVQKAQESFHRDFVQVAAQNGWLSGHLLELDGEPIAYLHGLLYNNIFCDLKSSYKQEYREMAPGHVLRAAALERLYERSVAIYDFMGECEQHKMVWTDKTYSRVTYVLYNGTIRGRAARLGQKVRHAMSRSARLIASK